MFSSARRFVASTMAMYAMLFAVDMAQAQIRIPLPKPNIPLPKVPNIKVPPVNTNHFSFEYRDDYQEQKSALAKRYRFFYCGHEHKPGNALKYTLQYFTGDGARATTEIAEVIKGDLEGLRDEMRRKGINPTRTRFKFGTMTIKHEVRNKALGVGWNEEYNKKGLRFYVYVDGAPQGEEATRVVSIQNINLASRGEKSYLSDAMPKRHNRVSAGEKWQLIPEGAGIYSIRSVHTQFYLSDAYPKLYRRSGKGEKWRLLPLGNNAFGIQNVNSGKYLSDSPQKLWHRLSTGEKWRITGA